MKYLSKEAYRDKVRGCWLGKNIGGTLGAPFEAVRSAADIEFYTHDLTVGALPNDDLDLQLAWLNACERFGTAVDAKILSEYWISAVTPNWAEYGVAKTNLRLGLEAPLSGGFENAFKDSNGAWIRSEIWACLMPGHPELAVRYAYQDAIVDHADEGVYAEVFTAALESAAFSTNDKDELLKIALSYIPQNCDIAKAIGIVKDCYSKGMTWKEARIELLTRIPDSFGSQLRKPNPDNLPTAPWGYDAPANIGIVVLAWLYGEGDFERSICIAAGCGEDGDCTTATIGSIMGIMLGASGLPEKWLEPIGDEIKTCSLNIRTDMVKIPQDITELTDRTIKLMPTFMRGKFDMFKQGGEIEMSEGENLLDSPVRKWTIKPYYFKDEYPESFMTFTGENTMMKISVTAKDGINIHEGETRELLLHAENVSAFVGNQLWLNLRWILPEGWSVSSGVRSAFFLNQYHCGMGHAFANVMITAGPALQAVNDVVLEVVAHDRPGRIYIPIHFISGT
ncbi:MAG: ADP-ribosylglycohydrolase family protein [Clostridiales bacterium]|nr:ADP-ribosylglycohydrolase family protein [Clostridiales bacterium]